MYTRTLWRLVAGFVVGVGFIPSVLGQSIEIEPNNTCPEAQLIGALATLPANVAGELAPIEDYNVFPSGDVDFYAFNATPGLSLRAGLRTNLSRPEYTLYNGFLGLFDSSCTLLQYNASYQGTDPKINFEVPEDSNFILAVSGSWDIDFGGYHWSQGTYLLDVRMRPEPIEGITGRVVDAVTGQPLAGYGPPYPWVELYMCRLGLCYIYINQAVPDQYGVFWFERAFDDTFLDPASYSLRVTANEYSTAEIGPFATTSGEIYDLGDIALQPPPYVFENIVACADIPVQGGTCTYSVDVRNNTTETVKGLGWSLVNAWGVDSPMGYSNFQPDKARAVQVKALGVNTMTFSFKVPGNVPAGATLCADFWFSDRDTSYFGALRTQGLFCVIKQYGEFMVLNADESAKLLSARGNLTGRQ